MKSFLRKHLGEILLVAGSGLAVYTTSILSMVAAGFVASAALIIFGVLVELGGDK